MLTKGVDQVLTILALQCDDLTTSTSYVRVDVERLPQVVNGGRTGHGTNIKQHANVGLQDGAKRVEEPSVRVDLLLILLLQTEDHLDRNQSAIRTFDLHGRRHRHCGAGLRTVTDHRSEIATDLALYTRRYGP